MEGFDPKLQEMNAKIDAIWKSVEKTRKYHLVTMWLTIVFLVVPLVAAMFVLPMFLTSYVGSYDTASLDPESKGQIELLQSLLE